MFASSLLGFSAQRPADAGSWVPVSNISRVDGVLAGVTAISADLALVAGAANGKFEGEPKGSALLGLSMLADGSTGFATTCNTLSNYCGVFKYVPAAIA